MLRDMVLKLEHVSEASGGLGKHRWLGPTSGAYDSVGLEWGLRICISNRFLGDIHASGLGSTH